MIFKLVWGLEWSLGMGMVWRLDDGTNFITQEGLFARGVGYRNIPYPSRAPPTQFVRLRLSGNI